MNYDQVIQAAARGNEATPQGAETTSPFDAKDFAKRVYRGEIFTSDQVRQGDESLFVMIFLPLALIGEKERRQMIDNNVTLLYGEMKDASPRGINGYPCFMAVGTLTKDQHQAFREAYRDIVALLGE